jgi:F0F1-type ATP synthase membrane subunit b/b'
MNDQTLERIRQQELKLQAGLLAARQQAEALIHEANRQSEDIRRASERDIVAELAALREQSAAETERELAEARTEFARQSEALAAGAVLVPALTSRLLQAVTCSDCTPPSLPASGTLTMARVE